MEAPPKSANSPTIPLPEEDGMSFQGSHLTYWESLIPSPFSTLVLFIQIQEPRLALSPQGCRAPAPEPSNGEQAGQHHNLS